MKITYFVQGAGLAACGMAVTTAFMAVTAVSPVSAYTDALSSERIEVELKVPEETSPVIRSAVLQFSSREIQCLRNMVYGEARSESNEAQIAVATTAINRALSDRWPDNLCEVVTQDNQFHGYSASITLKGIHDIKSWDNALAVARFTTANYAKLSEDLRSTYFFRSDGNIVQWRDKELVMSQVGKFNFYR